MESPHVVPSRSISQSLVRLLVTVVVLLLIRHVVTRLPMLEDIDIAGLPTSLGGVLGLAVLAVLLAVVYVLSSQIAVTLEERNPNVPGVAAFVRYLVLLLVVVIAYSAFRPLAVDLFGSDLWAYSIGFLILGLVPLLGLAVTIYYNIDYLTDLVVTGVRGLGSAGRVQKRVCPQCGAVAGPTVAFCLNCGTQLPVVTPPAGPVVCAQCGTELGPDVRFCGKCGAPRPEPAPAPAAEPEPEPQKPVQCQNCGAEVPVGSQFCGACGTAVGGPSEPPGEQVGPAQD